MLCHQIMLLIMISCTKCIKKGNLIGYRIDNIMYQELYIIRSSRCSHQTPAVVQLVPSGTGLIRGYSTMNTLCLQRVWKGVPEFEGKSGDCRKVQGNCGWVKGSLLVLKFISFQGPQNSSAPSASLLPHPLQGATLCSIAPIHLPIRKRSNQNSESQRTTTFSLICDFLSPGLTPGKGCQLQPLPAAVDTFGSPSQSQAGWSHPTLLTCK